MESAGFYGKLPSHGDFVSRRLTRDFLDPWDSWLQQCLAQSKADLGDGWLDTYLTSPIWRFVLTTGVCGDRAYVGMLMPSIDRVGRYFPLSVVAPVPAGASALSSAISAGRWFESTEQLLLSVLSDTAPDLDTFDRGVAEQTGQLMSLTSLERPTEKHAEAGVYWALSLPGDASPGLAICSLAGGIIIDRVGPTSWWWTSGTEISAAQYLAVSNLPSPATYALMLGSGQASPIPENWQDEAEANPVAPFSAASVSDAAQDPQHRDASTQYADLLSDSGSTSEALSLEALINSPLDLDFASASKSVTGKVRRENEDSLLDDTPGGLWLVADGMGGHAAGKTASTAIVKAMRDQDLPDDIDAAVETVIRTLQSVNRELRSLSLHHQHRAGLGSTIAVLVARRGTAAVVWAGDTRVYRMRGEQFDQLTVDHSEHQERLERGDINSILARETSVVTRAVGGHDVLQVSTIRQGLQCGDRYLICSDGVYQEVPGSQLAELLQSGDSEQACGAIIDAVLDGRAQDNATAVIVDCLEARR